ncbi:PDDEXK nuclease domain-containing protein [[Clostridium] leptum]|nr:PDDEXK nuclease domain-containing protein [[Clostridium] leptum]
MLINSNEYIATIEQVKQEIKAAQYKAAVHVNTELIMLYHSIGCVINSHKSWGNKFIENLAQDIKLEFPQSKGYSVRNLKYMAKFAATYPDAEFVQQVVAQIPWGHNLVLLDKVADTEERNWYIEACRKNGWSRNVLVHQIESGLYQRQALAEKVSNFEHRLPSPQSELAVQTMKDPYVFDFIPFQENMVERDIERALVQDVTKLLLELGTGFAFLGNQYHLNVGGDDFYLDLLFYNLNLRCYVVIELKTGEFKPEYAGQLNFYLSAVDGILKKDADNPSIGLLLCKSKNDLVAEYSLKDMSKPIGVSEYKITSTLPEELEQQLPSIEDLQKRIQK